jgi:6-phosphogluconolactonase
VVTEQLKKFVYVGSWSSTETGGGIYLCSLDLRSGALKLVDKVDSISTFFLEEKCGFLYATNDSRFPNGERVGRVSTFVIDQTTGRLTPRNSMPSGGILPCYMSFSERGECLAVANYETGNIAIFLVDRRGNLNQLALVTVHEGNRGSMVVPERQEHSHPHCVVFDHTMRFLFVVDLGMDAVILNSPLYEVPWVQAYPGAGPRHMVFHPTQPFAYIINELNNTLVGFNYDSTDGSLRQFQTVKTLPEDFQGTSYAADVKIEPFGNVLYATNRGHDSIVGYSVDRVSGRLELLGHTPCGGEYPWNLACEPFGEFLLVANYRSDNVVVFKVERTGQLVFTGHQVHVPKPVCLKIV